MEVAIIDWKNINSRFVKDEMYEHINAPNWVDFADPVDSVDDEAWFCRPSCNHPKTAEDFFKEKEKNPNSNSKHQRSVSVPDILSLGDRNRREATLKKRGTNPPSMLPNKNTIYDRIAEESENQNPNLSTPPNHNKAKYKKEAIKSSTEKNQIDDNFMTKDQTPKLKSTLSARNLFSGGDLLNKVAEFCNELKKLATRENRGDVEKRRKDCLNENCVDLNEKEKEKKPLLELNKENSQVMEIRKFKEKKIIRKKLNDDSENTPISIDVKNIKRKEGGLLQIRTSPPTPQCFSAGQGHSMRITTPKVLRSKPMGRGILQELKPTKKEEKMVEHQVERTNGRETPVHTTADKEARIMNAFWFLKPCTLSN